ncbi:hypothetical protein V1511DRAFT_493366 [Dipodascopsis uninucleata]
MINIESLKRTIAVAGISAAVLSTLWYAIRPWDSSVEGTTFTPSRPFVVLFWVTELVAQAAFCHALFVGDDDAKPLVTWVAVFDVIHALWCIFVLSFGQMLIGIFLAGVNFASAMIMYSAKRTLAIDHPRTWIAVHIGGIAVPLAWSMVCLFWTGAGLFRATGTSAVSRFFADIFVWSLLVLPAAGLVLYADWALAGALAFLVWALATTQLSSDHFGLEGVFLLVIAVLLTVGTTAIGLVRYFTAAPDLRTVAQQARHATLSVAASANFATYGSRHSRQEPSRYTDDDVDLEDGSLNL